MLSFQYDLNEKLPSLKLSSNMQSTLMSSCSSRGGSGEDWCMNNNLQTEIEEKKDQIESLDN